MTAGSGSELGALLRSAARAALRWRVLLSWILAGWIPTAVLALPIWRMLAQQLDRSAHAADWARHADLVMLLELSDRATRSGGGALAGSGIAAAALLLATMPLLNGLLVVAARAETSPGFGALLRGGLDEYGLMLRLMAWSLLPLALAGGLGALALQGVQWYARRATTEASVQVVAWIAYAGTGLLLALALAVVDAARARVALHPRRRSAFGALCGGFGLLFAEPRRAAGIVLCITLAGALAIGVLGLLRAELAAATVPGLVAGWLVVQGIVAVTAWMHFARLIAMRALLAARVTAALA